MLSATQQMGHLAETAALNYLAEQGLTLVSRNYRCKQGEIDLIMQDQQYYIFVEVRYRCHSAHGNPLETITRAKQLRIIKAATAYLLQRKLYDKVSCRFDIVAIEENEQSICWIKDAFQVQ